MVQRHLIATVPRETGDETIVSPDEEPGSSQAEDPLSLPDDEPPSISQLKRTPRPALWADVPDAKWDDWHWQLANRLNSPDELARLIHLTDEEIEGLTADDKFRVDITPYFASLIDPDDPTCPVRGQVIPKGRELQAFDGMMEDSLAEDAHSPVPGLVHRYPDRVLMLVTTQCASYCRYCTRSRLVGDPHRTFSKADFERQLDYLRATPGVRDVLMSGGDPLTLAPKTLEYILAELRKIEHIEIIRIGSRVPVFLPQRITDEFCAMIRKYHPLWMNIHVNHPKEITPELSRALEKLSYAGVPLGNQSVLLAGINDSVAIQKDLVHKLVRNRVRPYYLYQCDLVKGAGHFRTTVSKGIEIIEGLRGHTSGYAVPTYVVDAPGGGGKIPVMPQYLISQAPGKVVLRNYEGYITAYDEPTDYDPGMIEHLNRPRQAGVSGLLAGDATNIKPEGFDGEHQRNPSLNPSPSQREALHYTERDFEKPIGENGVPKGIASLSKNDENEVSKNGGKVVNVARANGQAGGNVAKVVKVVNGKAPPEAKAVRLPKRQAH